MIAIILRGAPKFGSESGSSWNPFYLFKFNQKYGSSPIWLDFGFWQNFQSVA